MGVGEISIHLQRVLTFGDAVGGALVLAAGILIGSS
jgi:hypothetical protein